VDEDLRSYRVALVADELVNPEPGGFDALEVIERLGWGAIQLPSAWYPDEVAAGLLTQVAEQVHELSAHGYEIVLVGQRAGLDEALQAIGLGPPDAVSAATADELQASLSERATVRPLAAESSAASATSSVATPSASEQKTRSGSS
jgi:hypothetical protein